jgi:NAD(P)-dependent dehydrogenase (short-subunit alcohol dehydrogenase family)
MSLSSWSIDQIPGIGGKTIVVTGANSGIGYEAARLFAGKSAHVIIACRNKTKGNAAADKIRGEVEDASVDVRELDLANLSSVRDFAAAFDRDHGALHVLCNNAGVMAVPQSTTADGFEMQLGTNHLGHFALTGLLMNKMLATPGSRVVSVTSAVHHVGKINFGDLQSERSYSPWPAYAQSKLANLLFAYELNRQLRATNANTISLACHPGYSATNLQSHTGSNLMTRMMAWSNETIAQTATMGAMPTVFAATAPDAQGGDIIGPDGFMEISGYPVKSKSSKRSHDRNAQAELWRRSEELTNVNYSFEL